MSRPSRLAVLIGILAVVAPGLGADGKMKAEWIFDGSEPHMLKTRFGKYGYHPTQTVRPEPGSVRFWLPARDNVGQTGLYSLISLAGDCEVIVTYEFLNLETPTTGYGSGLGLTFDVGEGGEDGRGSIQRIEKPKEGQGHVYQTNLPASRKKMNEVYQFQRDESLSSGRIGLRRVKKELIFLASDPANDELVEVKRLPFSDHTIRKVRLHVDPGGSPTAIDLRVRRIECRAQEMTGGIPHFHPKSPSRWWMWAIPALVASLLFWLWRRSRAAT